MNIKLIGKSLIFRLALKVLTKCDYKDVKEQNYKQLKIRRF
jgi:hypothetical protein